MSRASKITLFTSIVATTITVAWVHKVQEEEKQALHQGPIKDAKRMEEKRLKKKLLVNQQEHEYQQELRKKFEQIQPLSGKTVTGPEEDSEK
ncbi:CYFA0S12e03752g1_1 [Cyberlindnera fabianii]|uniref:CYFA0S12e03752g1_1 n=1 Tax=Cyberlindnera fabianii TaxID=36022 RepID=A0A061B1N8_CYBFA|nr:hypothetical protein BON22_4735 [Cyberlindnera fabianii]CDR43735.1 CYFA0S12e03752g1_1 [Cyberlindnera fabianii]